MNNEPISENYFKPAELVAVAFTLLIAACTAPGGPVGPAAQGSAEVVRPAPAERDFPPVASATWKQGAFPSNEALRMMGTGIGQDQVRRLLSWPHFGESFNNVRDWNYIFHFRIGAGPAHVTCQYMVRFSEQMVTTGAYWQTPDCASVAKGLSAVRPVVKPLAAGQPTAARPHKITLSADRLFGSDRASPTHVLPEGMRQVELLAREIRRSFGSVRAVSVTAHTDRLGSEARNGARSLAQANAVRDLLVRHGIDTSVIRAAGAGETQPQVECPIAKAARIAHCDRANRRVEIEVLGAQ
ncbi:MAG: OmpA family protein [Variovorax sp.]